MKSRKKLLFLCQAAIIAALYVALTLVANAAGLSSLMIQVRFSEALCVLAAFTPAAVPGLYVGCLLANVITSFSSGFVVLDIIFGPIATLIGVLGAYWLRRHKWLITVPTILSNTIIVPFILAYGYGITQTIPLMMLTVGAGEVISAGILGMALYFALYKNANKIFKL